MFTPGPYLIAAEKLIIDKNGKTIAVMYGEEPGNLISASYEMYEQLKHIMIFLEGLEEADIYKRGHVYSDIKELLDKIEGR